jgi:hypothetical protein
MTELLSDVEKEGLAVEVVEYALRLSQLDELWESALDCSMETQRRMILTEEGRGECKNLKEGDLILLRRHIVDKERGHKLKPKWIGPSSSASQRVHDRLPTQTSILLTLLRDVGISIKSGSIALEQSVLPPLLKQSKCISPI